MTQIDKNGCQYIEHHGIKIRLDQLVSMAKRAGVYTDAKPYVESILYHAVKYKVWDLIYKVIEIWDFYSVKPYSLPESGDEDEVVAPLPRTSIDDMVRKQYRSMTISERTELFKSCLGTFIANNPKLFRFKNQWQGIYLVVRDRLDYGLSYCDFLNMVLDSIPNNWPVHLMISENVIKNLGRAMAIPDDEAYYELKYNPMERLCDTFWDVVKAKIMENEA